MSDTTAPAAPDTGTAAVEALADLLNRAQALIATPDNGFIASERVAALLRALVWERDAARAEVERLENELARYRGMTMHADHPTVIAAERDRLRAEVAALRGAMLDAKTLDDAADIALNPATWRASHRTIVARALRLAARALGTGDGGAGEGEVGE